MLLSQGQMNDRMGAGLLIDALPPARDLLPDRGMAAIPADSTVREVHDALHPAAQKPRDRRRLRQDPLPPAAPH